MRLGGLDGLIGGRGGSLLDYVPEVGCCRMGGAMGGLDSVLRRWVFCANGWRQDLAKL